MENIGEIKKVKDKKEKDFFKQSNVTGTDVGYKYVKGKKTDELAIRVYVKEKKKIADLKKSEVIPKTVSGIKTDVIQREFKLFPSFMKIQDLAIMSDTGTYDPLQGGISIGPCRSVYCTPPYVDAPGNYLFVGTLGVIVTDNDTGDPMMLSNYHVMCVDDQWSVADTIAQPSRAFDGGVCPRDVVGTVTRAVINSSVDAAVARITNRQNICEIVDIGTVNGTATATMNENVRKRGRTTGLTFGTVGSLSLTVRVQYHNSIGSVLLTNQISIDVDSSQSATFGIGGDSGSVVVNEDDKIIGLFFAGNIEERDGNGNIIVPEGIQGIANPIQAVLDELDVSLCIEPKETEIAKKAELEPLKFVQDVWKWLYEPTKWKAEPDKIILEPQKWKREPPKRIYEGYFEPPHDFFGFATSEERITRLEEIIERLGQYPPTLRDRNCIDFTRIRPQPLPNPWMIRNLKITSRDHQNALYPGFGIKTMGGSNGLEMGFKLDIQSRRMKCRCVELTLVHFSSPATIRAYNSDHSLAGTATMNPRQGKPETITLCGESINRIVIDAPQNEVLLLKICCLDRKRPKILEKENTKDFGKDVLKEKDVLDTVEDPGKLRESSIVGQYSPDTAESINSRLDRLEAAIAQASHFIPKKHRPDLSKGALARESDCY